MARTKKSISVAPGLPQIEIPTVGVTPLLSYADPVNNELRSKVLKNLGQHLIQGNNPFWNDEEELYLMASAGMTSMASTQKLLSFSSPGIPTGNSNINDRFSKRHTVADLNIPRNPTAVIQLSLRYATENPFVNKAANVKTNFTCKDFKHKTHKTSAKDFYDDYAIKLHLYTQLPKIVWSLYTVGFAAIYWGGEDGGPIEYMQVLPPTSVHLEEILGRQKLYLKIDAKMIAAVKDPTGEKDIRNKALYESMPSYWIAQIKKVIDKGAISAIGMIELQEGSYAVPQNRYMPNPRAINTLDGVPLQAAFDALQRYRLLSAGDFAVAWGIKNMITLISEGDPKVDPKNYVPMNEVRMAKLMSTFLSPDYELKVFCDPTTNIRYFVPPLEVFDPKKYAQVEREILICMGLPSYFTDTNGNSSYGAAVAESEMLQAEIDWVRLILREEFFRPLYSRLRQGATRPGFAEKDIPLPEFDRRGLRDNIQNLQANQELYQAGALSLETLLEESDHDYLYEVAQKKLEHKELGNTSTEGVELNNTPMRPLFEQSQGSLTQKEVGRPAKANGNPADKNANSARRPRTTGK